MEKTRVLSNRERPFLITKDETQEDVYLSCVEGLWVLTISGTVATVGSYDDVVAHFSFFCGKE